MDLQYGDKGYSTCVMRARSSHEKAERRGLFCHLNHSCWKLYDINRCCLNFFHSLVAERGAILPAEPRLLDNCMTLTLDPTLTFSSVIWLHGGEAFQPGP